MNCTKKRIFLWAVLFLSSPFLLNAQDQPKDSIYLSPIEIIAQLPITQEIITKKQLSDKNMGQDLPILLDDATNIVTTSDAGAGIGYTSLRLRGIGQNQINVSFNGVPVNDSESHGVFWVDFPDIASSTEGIAIQRGVGTSSNGATSFGGSINLDTNKRNPNAFGNAQVNYGSFESKKYMLHGGSGDFAQDKFNIDARATYQSSDGYIDRASSELFSTNINARYIPSDQTEIQVTNIFGHERTYQAWNGIDVETLEKDRTYNSAGAIYDDAGNVVDFYKNEVDNYDQNHLHFYWKQRYSHGWRSTTTLHYTRGKGYYENYKQGEDLSEYNITGLQVTQADVIRKKWLDNHFYGGIFNLENTRLGKAQLYLGVAANEYVGDHYGEIPRVVGQDEYVQNGTYYGNRSHKTEISSFAKALYKIGRIELFGDMQIRHIRYNGKYLPGGENDNEDFRPFDLNYTFLNPKAGIDFKFNQSKIYASYGMTHREPTRTDILESNTTKEETLHDFELGYSTQNSRWSLGVNTYYMKYKNQLVLTGEINDVGSPIRENVGDSYRAGVELETRIALVKNHLDFSGNIAWSQNKNKNYYATDSNGALVNYGDTDISFSPKIVSAIGLDFSPTQRFSISWSNKYVSEQFVTNTENKSLRLDAYWVSNLLSKYNLPLRHKRRLEISVMVNNLFNHLYESNGYAWGEYLYLYPQAGINYLTGIKLYF